MPEDTDTSALNPLNENDLTEDQERPNVEDPLMALYGSGKDLWSDEHADEYVARLRDGW